MDDAVLQKLKIDKGNAPTGVPRHRGRLLKTAAVLLVAAAVALLLIRRGGVTVETATVVQVFPTQSFTQLNASGYLVAQRKAAVASKITGRLEWLGVEEGSRVKAGQVLARLESWDLAAALDQARAALETAQAGLEQARAERDDAQLNFQRQQQLIGQGIVARAEYDTAEARHRRAVAGLSGAEAAGRAAAAALRGAQAAYGYAEIRAPFDGVVLTKNADVGDIITPLGAASTSKAAVVTMADLSSLEVEADVAESSLALVRPGQPCEILLDALPGVRLRGQVHTIVPTADRSKASVLVKVRMLDRDLRALPEMSAKVAFLSRAATAEDQRPRTAVMHEAVSGQGQDGRLYRIVDNRATAVNVGVGPRQGELVEVTGVQPGDRVVLRPLQKITDGTPVKVLEK